MKHHSIRFISIITFCTFLFSQPSGKISGIVVNKETHQPIQGVNVTVVDTKLGSATDNFGRYIINNVPIGSYTIQVNMIGYSSITRANINIKNDNITQVNFNLEQSVLEGAGIIVTEGYFEKSNDAIVSNRSMDYEEIRSDPVGIYDIQMMMNALPSVVSESDQSNEIIVRGGDTGENLFVMDNLEIPNPNHFGDVGSGGGPINIINAAFIDRIDFFAGGFPAKYGDKQSSVMDVTLREGNKNENEIEMEANMAGVGLNMEGPLFNKKGSYMASYRKSFLKYIIKSAGLTAVPEYWHSQLKVVYELNKKDKIIFNYITGDDEVNVEDENRPDLGSADHIDHSGSRTVIGLTYKSLFSKNGYFQWSLAQNISSWDAEVYNKINGSRETYFQRDNVETDSYLKGDFVYKISNRLTFSSGINMKVGGYSLHEKANPDTVFVYYYYDYNNQTNSDYFDSFSTLDDYFEWVSGAQNWYPDSDEIEPTKYFSSIIDFIHWREDNDISDDPIIGVYDSNPTLNTYVNPGMNLNADGSLWKYSAYSQLKFSLMNKFIINAGLHYDKVNFNNTNKLSPRFGISYNINPITTINLALGQYYQTPFYWMLLNPKNMEETGEPLGNSHTDQIIFGIERYLAQDTKITLEYYEKKYFNTPVYRAVLTDTIFDRNLGFDDIGEGNAKGIELFIQKKYSNNWYFTFSYSNSIAEEKDPRKDSDGFFPRTYDYGQVLTCIGGYKLRFWEYDWYRKYKKNRLFNILSWIPILPSDILEISFRYRYLGGRPYTLRNYLPSRRRWQYIDEWNTERYGYYSRLDVMILRRMNFDKFNITTYIDIQNIFNRNNDWEFLYLPDGTKEMAYQYKQLPIGGITIEF